MASFRNIGGGRRLGLIAGLALAGVIVIWAIFSVGDWSGKIGVWFGVTVEEPSEHILDLAIVNGKVAEEMRVIRVSKGDLVRLRWTVDEPMDIHLHGYDIEQKAAPGDETIMTFTTFATGRFPVEAHLSGEGARGAEGDSPTGIILLYLEVHPR